MGTILDECDTESQLCVNYSLSRSLNEFVSLLDMLKREGSSGLQPFSPTDKLENGYLQEEMDKIIFWVVANYHYKKKELQKCVVSLSKAFKLNDCQQQVLSLLAKASQEVYKMESHHFAISTYAWKIRCDYDLGVGIDTLPFAYEFIYKYLDDTTYLKAHTNHAEIWGSMGGLLYQLEKYDLSHAASQVAILLDSTNSGYWGVMGFSLKNQDEPQMAAEAFVRGYANDTTAFYLLTAFAEVLLEEGETQDGLLTLEYVLEKDSLDIVTWEIFATALGEADFLQESKSAYEKALRIDSCTYRLWANYGKTLHRMEEDSLAKMAFRRATSLNPNDTSSWYSLGILHESLGETEQAIKYFNRVLELDSLFALGWYRIGIVYFNAGKLEEAKKAFKLVHALNPNAPMPPYYLDKIRAIEKSREQQKDVVPLKMI